MYEQKLSALVQGRLSASLAYKPLILSPRLTEDLSSLMALLQDEQVTVFDTFSDQLGELIKLRHPKERFSAQALAAAAQAQLGTEDSTHWGVWVYYPWCKRLVHTLDERDFIQVRTSRNRYKITAEEQRQLASKRVGIIGLSVGQAIALPLMMERSCGELRLADFDCFELSNLNRVRTGIHSLGVSKVIAAAREIAELDPFFKVTCFLEGVTDDNLDLFFTAGGALDLLIEECDSLDIKISARHKAKALGIPVLMHTSDRGMVDVERFDRDPQRPILHGLVEHLDTTNLKNLTNEQKVPYVLAMLGIDAISDQFKASMMEIEQTITTWPQLASAVTLGGAIVGDLARRILLDQFHDSDRYFIDFDELVKDQAAPAQPHSEAPVVAKSAHPLTTDEMMEMVKCSPAKSADEPIRLDGRGLTTLVEAATLAPSGGNVQPWQWLYQDGYLYLFRNPAKAVLLDFEHTASYLALGAAAENLVLQAHALQLEVKLQTFISQQQQLVAVFSFYADKRGVANLEAHCCDPLIHYVPLRTTNRNLSQRQTIQPAYLQQLQQIGQTVAGAQVTFLESDAALTEFASIAGAVERLRLLNPTGHHDFVHEMRWTPEEAQSTRDGVDLATIDLTLAERAGFQMAKSWPVMAYVKRWQGGGAFEKVMKKSIAAASAVGFLTMPNRCSENFFAGGRALQRLWLTATQQQLALQPVASATFIFAHLLYGTGAGFDDHALHELKSLRERFVSLFPLVAQQQGEILLFRLAIADAPKVKALRCPVEQVLTIHEP